MIILILAPHTDDCEIGVGGTISRFIKESYEIHCLVFSPAIRSIPKCFNDNSTIVEAKAAFTKLTGKLDNHKILDFPVREFNIYRQNILEEMVMANRIIKPDIIFTPSSFDIHQDHQIIYEESIRAFKMNCTILGYESLLNNLSFSTDCFIRLDESDINNKMLAVNEYKSQLYKRNISEVLRNLAKLRGAQIGYQYAEAFEVIRCLVK